LDTAQYLSLPCTSAVYLTDQIFDSVIDLLDAPKSIRPVFAIPSPAPAFVAATRVSNPIPFTGSPAVQKSRIEFQVMPHLDPFPH